MLLLSNRKRLFAKGSWIFFMTYIQTILSPHPSCPGTGLRSQVAHRNNDIKWHWGRTSLRNPFIAEQSTIPCIFAVTGRRYSFWNKKCHLRNENLQLLLPVNENLVKAVRDQRFPVRIPDGGEGADKEREEEFKHFSACLDFLVERGFIVY